MKTVKMSLDNIQGKLSRSEMKGIIAGMKNAEATVTCPGGEVKGRDCGSGNSAVATETTICCGGNDDCVQMCPVV